MDDGTEPAAYRAAERRPHRPPASAGANSLTQAPRCRPALAGPARSPVPPTPRVGAGAVWCRPTWAQDRAVCADCAPSLLLWPRRGISARHDQARASVGQGRGESRTPTVDVSHVGADRIPRPGEPGEVTQPRGITSPGRWSAQYSRGMAGLGRSRDVGRAAPFLLFPHNTCGVDR